MKLKPVIERLEAQVSALKTVGGAADVAAAGSAMIVTPAAYLVPVSDRAEANSLSAGAVSQRVLAGFGVLMAVSNVSDTTGEAAHDELEELRVSVIAALLGWQHPDHEGIVSYARGRLIAFSDRVLWWLDEFTSEFYLRAT